MALTLRTLPSVIDPCQGSKGMRPMTDCLGGDGSHLKCTHTGDTERLRDGLPLTNAHNPWVRVC